VQHARQRLAGRGLDRRLGPRREVVQQALQAARDLQQLAVLLVAPAPRQAARREGLVEGDQVAVAFGLGQRAVEIPDQCREHQAASLLAVSASSRSTWSAIVARWSKSRSGRASATGTPPL
jgi:hypothetical protein